ncbi:hypothetical protein [Vibrio genomosp. F10]|uniref:Uncharacterized protein n=2 Tax=Vibrio genomosp. F10 TaxID=723171 RepID=A0A1B9QWM3_9VIBR|nr:hypothetical protein [Vibrio genomosp. F10]OCH73996.1 hypothetical protein A6E14_13525 [Vibrio genomosp. F10]OEE32927.1 hypothetical protein A1QO_11035 [Vibrio genomosp. F10 str. ZF-129]OEE92956.1 hypothetical protein A1QM_11045 [Vibrio genomosp. F10 str. 9ZC157]OEF08534.1 hypothetical protein A1QI_16030 [Vibrio genomosp. F10 str. 9ZB36]
MTSTTIASPRLVKWFNGDIALWKAVLIQILGTYALLFLLESSKIALSETTVVMLKIGCLPLFAIYSSICVFRAAPNFKSSIRGTVAKCWAVTFILWALATAYALIVFALPEL